MGLPDDLERLAALHRSGALSDAEFASAKARALGAAPQGGGHGKGLAGAARSLRRSRHDRWIGGVCGGLATASDLPSWLWRLVFVVLALCGGSGLVFYVLMWILLPTEEAGVDTGTGTGTGTGPLRST